MYHHIERIKFIKLDVELYIFNKILAHRLFEFSFEKTAEWRKCLEEDNKFIRFKHNDWYIDATFKILEKDHFILFIQEIIDWDKKKVGRVWSEKQRIVHSKKKNK